MKSYCKKNICYYLSDVSAHHSALLSYFEVCQSSYISSTYSTLFSNENNPCTTPYKDLARYVVFLTLTALSSDCIGLAISTYFNGQGQS